MPLCCVLKIIYFHFLSHFCQAAGEFVYNVHFNIKLNRQSGVLMGRVYGTPCKEIDIRGIFKQHSCDLRRPVVFFVPITLPPVLPQIVLSVFQDMAQCDHTLRYQIYTF